MAKDLLDQIWKVIPLSELRIISYLRILLKPQTKKLIFDNVRVHRDQAY